MEHGGPRRRHLPFGRPGRREGGQQRLPAEQDAAEPVADRAANAGRGVEPVVLAEPQIHREHGSEPPDRRPRHRPGRMPAAGLEQHQHRREHGEWPHDRMRDLQRLPRRLGSARHAAVEHAGQMQPGCDPGDRRHRPERVGQRERPRQQSRGDRHGRLIGRRIAPGPDQRRGGPDRRQQQQGDRQVERPQPGRDRADREQDDQSARPPAMQPKRQRDHAGHQQHAERIGDRAPVDSGHRRSVAAGKEEGGETRGKRRMARDRTVPDSVRVRHARVRPCVCRRTA